MPNGMRVCAFIPHYAIGVNEIAGFHGASLQIIGNANHDTEFVEKF